MHDCKTNYMKTLLEKVLESFWLHKIQNCRTCILSPLSFKHSKLEAQPIANRCNFKTRKALSLQLSIPTRRNVHLNPNSLGLGLYLRCLCFAWEPSSSQNMRNSKLVQKVRARETKKSSSFDHNSAQFQESYGTFIRHEKPTNSIAGKLSLLWNLCEFCNIPKLTDCRHEMMTDILCAFFESNFNLKANAATRHVKSCFKHLFVTISSFHEALFLQLRKSLYTHTT